jgi:hypothetical protein
MQQNGYEHSLGGARSDPMSTPAAAPINATAPKTNRLNIFFKSKHKKFEGINAGKLITQQKPTNQIKSNQNKSNATIIARICYFHVIQRRRNPDLPRHLKKKKKIARNTQGVSGRFTI